ncbi:LPS assembly protein LptD [Hyphomicrobiales bacterium]|nr:LPS assembly protein LptD [Hyphomicrobiales bacterium]
MIISIIISLLSVLFFPVYGQENISNSIESDKIEYLNDSSEIKAIGSVKITRGNFELNADEILFNQKNNIIEGNGNIIIKERGGPTIIASQFKLSSDLNDGIIKLPSLVTKDGTNISSAYAIRSGGKSIVLKKGIFSPCKKCQNSDKKVSWQVKANRIIYDEVSGNIIYEGAKFELFGFPIFYVPIATHPSPDIKRRTGFLAPEIMTSGDLGLSIKTPYFMNLAPNYDLTITPWAITKGALVAEGEWRQRFKRGKLNFHIIAASLNDDFKSKTVNINDDWSAIINSPFNSPENLSAINKKLAFDYDDNTHSITNVEVADKDDSRPSSIADSIGYDFRGSFAASGNFQFNNWNLDFSGKFVSDDTFLRRFNLGDETDIKSYLSLSRHWGNAKLKINSIYYSSLLPEKEGSEPLILPEVKFSWNPEKIIFGGKSKISINTLGIVRKTDGNTYRVSSEIDWERQIINNNGHIFKLNLNIRGDAYRTSKKWTPNNSSRLFLANPLGQTRDIYRLLPSVDIEWKLPLKYDFSNTIIEPIIQIAYSVDSNKNIEIPNEDSISFELNSHNIFTRNRMPGIDLWETGSRINYGFKFSHFFNESGVFSALVGQSYKFKNPDSFEKGSGLDEKLSDFVLDFLFRPNKEITISYKGRLDDNDIDLRRSEFDMLITYPKWGIRAGHVLLNNVEILNFKEQREARLATFFNITEGWLIQAALRYDVVSKNSLNNRISAVYIDDCMSFEIGFRRKFSEYRDLKPSNSFMIKFNVFTFGGGTLDSSDRISKLWEN